MYTSFADQLAGLDLSGFSIGPAPLSTTRLPASRSPSSRRSKRSGPTCSPWSRGRLSKPTREDLGWALVNIFHRSATRKSTAVDRATDEVRALIATADGSEVHTHDLETQVERAQCAEGAMLALEEMREVAAALYLNEFGSSWKPVSSSRFNHSVMLTSALVEGRDFVRARSEAKRRAAMPVGTPVIFAGGRTRHPDEQDALTFANNVWATLDKVRRACCRHGSRPWRRHQGCRPLGLFLGRAAQRSPSQASRSTCAWVRVPASSATSACFRSIRDT